MITLLKYCFLFIFLVVSHSYAMGPSIDDPIILEDLIENAEFENARDVYENDQFLQTSSTRPLGISLEESQSRKLYAGIYRFTVNTPTDIKDYSFYFKDFATLKGKNNALLVIDFPKNWRMPATVKKFEMTLPAMDTVINGDVNGAQIFIDRFNDKNNKNEYRYFFFGKQSKTVKIRVAGKVFAHDLEKFSPIEAGFSIKELPENIYRRFIIKNTFSDGTIKPDTSRFPPARHHQISQLVDYAHARLKNANYITFEAATGSGKTRTMYYLLSELLDKNQKALIVTSRLNLISQMKGSFGEQNQRGEKKFRVGSTTDNDYSIEKINNYDILLTTIQGFQINGNYEKLKSLFDVIIFDEAHNLFSKKRLYVVNELKNSNPKKQLLFFTATPTRSERHSSGLLSVYELSEELEKSYIKPYGILEAIDDEVNAPFQIALVKNPAFIGKKLKITGDDFSKRSVAKKLSVDAINEVVLDIYQNGRVNDASLSKKKSIAFCSNIQHAESLKTFLNDKNVDYDADGIMKYNKNVRMYFESLEPNKLPPEFYALWRLIYKAPAYNITEKVIEEFLNAFMRNYPYTFADSVHSGNEKYKMSSDEAEARLLRFRLGGTKILCGADKLTEGFDDPRLEVAFFLTPTKSRIKVMQRFGRILRTNPDDPEKIAIGFDFLFDNRQLLINSVNAAGRMSYGLADPVSITINKQAKQNYEVATDLVYKGTEKKKRIKLKKENTLQKEKKPKNRIVKIKKAEIHVENLLDEMKKETEKLKLMAEDLKKYTLVNYIDLMSILDAPRTQRSSETSHKSGFDIMPDEADKSIKELKIALKPVLDFFSNSPGHEFWANFVDVDSQKPQASDEDGLALYLKNIISHAHGVLNRANNFVTNCQMGDARKMGKAVQDKDKIFNELFDEAFGGMEEEQADVAENNAAPATNKGKNSPDNFNDLFNEAYTCFEDDMLSEALERPVSLLENLDVLETQNTASENIVSTTNCTVLTASGLAPAVKERCEKDKLNKKKKNRQMNSKRHLGDENLIQDYVINNYRPFYDLANQASSSERNTDAQLEYYPVQQSFIDNSNVGFYSITVPRTALDMSYQNSSMSRVKSNVDGYLQSSVLSTKDKTKKRYVVVDRPPPVAPSIVYTIMDEPPPVDPSSKKK